MKILIITDDINEWVKRLLTEMPNAQTKKVAGDYYVGGEVFWIKVTKGLGMRNNKTSRFDIVVFDKYINSYIESRCIGDSQREPIKTHNYYIGEPEKD